MSSGLSHPDDLDRGDYRPGTRVILDGVPLQMVVGTEVPRAYWDWLHTNLGKATLQAVALDDDGQWTKYDSIDTLYESGSVIGPHHPRYAANRGGMAGYCCLVPVVYLAPEENEFGRICP